MDQAPAPGTVQPEILSFHALDLASNAMDQLATVKGSLASIQHILERLLPINQNPLSAPAPAAPAPALGPDFSTQLQKKVLQPNPPLFSMATTQGQMFLHSVLTYLQLVPEAFMTNRRISEEKLRFIMSFMAKDAAAQWAE
jgi:hypothetical protein